MSLLPVHDSLKKWNGDRCGVGAQYDCANEAEPAAIAASDGVPASLDLRSCQQRNVPRWPEREREDERGQAIVPGS